MEPIINPWVFYAIDISDNLKFFIGLVSVIVGAIAVVSAISYVVCITDDYFDEWKLRFKTTLHTTLKYLVPLIILFIFIPNSNTILKMIVADNITPHNIEVVGDTIENSIDYIFEKINKIDISEKSRGDE